MLRLLPGLLLAAASLAFAPTATAQVRITEFLARNDSRLADSEGHFTDWIELHNAGPAAVPLEGWHLTDSPTDLARWTFPAVTLDPGQFLVVFASGKNRANPGAQLHTNFKLAGGGGYLALVQPDGATVASAFAPAYPPQEPDISYGLADEAGQLVPRFFSPPTPGTPNGQGHPGIASPPVITPPGGLFRNSTQATVIATSPGAVIRYTLDGSAPDTNSTPYTGPIPIFGTRLLRAQTFAPNLIPSPIAGAAFTRIGADAAAFSSDLPLLVVNTFARTIVDGTRNPAYLEALGPLPQGSRTSLDSPRSAASRMTIEIRGSSSTGFEKKSYGVELQDESGQDSPASLAGLPADSDWVLYAPYTDKTLMRDVLAYELSRRINRYAPRTRFVELFVNRGNTDLQMADYLGVYVVVEKLKIGPDRINVAEMAFDDLTEPAISGGYLLKRDRFDANDQVFTTGRAVQLGIEDPKRTQIGATQRNWIRTWLNQMEAALYGTNWRDPAAGYRAFLDPDSFIDHHWLVEAARNIDGYRLSTFWFKDRGGRLNMGPLWDYNLSFGNADYLNGWMTNGWYYTSVNDPGHTWFNRLLQDPDYQQRRIDRWFLHRSGPLATTNVVSLIDNLASQLRESQARNFDRWRILGRYIWPNWFIGQTWQQEVDWMKRWTTNRFAWIDRQFIAPPSPSHPGGSVPDGLTLVLRPASGTLYYSLDGSDPRLPGGSLSPTALPYTGPIGITSSTLVFARSRSAANWSAPFRAAYVVQPSTLTLSEVMYHPPDPNPAIPAESAFPDPEDFEYVELANHGSNPVPLPRTRLTGNITFEFPEGADTLLPGERIVVTRNPAAFTARYGPAPRATGPYSGTLSNNRGTITLHGPFEEPLVSLDYDDDWQPSTDGRGFALTAIQNPGPGVPWNQASNWRPSSVTGGTPGRADVPDLGPPVFLGAWRDGQTLRLQFQANPGAGLRLQRRTSLTPTPSDPWLDIQDVPPTADGIAETSDPSPPNNQPVFYRLVTPRR